MNSGLKTVFEACFVEPQAAKVLTEKQSDKFIAASIIGIEAEEFKNLNSVLLLAKFRVLS